MAALNRQLVRDLAMDGGGPKKRSPNLPLLIADAQNRSAPVDLGFYMLPKLGLIGGSGAVHGSLTVADAHPQNLASGGVS
jgi:hypothetical protein